MAKAWLELVPVLQRAVAPDGPLHGVAVLSPSGEPVGTAGALAHYEVRSLAALGARRGEVLAIRELGRRDRLGVEESAPRGLRPRTTTRPPRGRTTAGADQPREQERRWRSIASQRQ